MMKATIEILYEDETIWGATPDGVYMVRYYDEEEEEIGGSFHKTIEEAEVEVRNYQNTSQEEEE